jgi:hypothetical protein
VIRLRTAVRDAHLATVLFCVSLSAWPAGSPSAADLARCAAITAPDARLACYDSLFGSANSSAPAAAAAAKTPAAASPGTATAPAPAPSLPQATVGAEAASAVPAASAPKPAPVQEPAAKAAPTVAPLDDPKNFGFSAAQVHAVPQGLQSIDVHVVNVLTDRLGDAFVMLDNGQMWAYQGDDGRLRPGDSVTIKRASLGSFIMVTPSKRSYHVTRTR